MTEINFYCVKDDITLFLFSLLTKLTENNKRIIIYSEYKEKMENLDSILWTQKKTSFLPHLLEYEKEAKNTSIVLANTKSNINNANYLLISNFVDDENFLHNFEKIFYVFSANNLVIANNVKKNWKFYENLKFKLKFFEQDLSDKWITFDNIENSNFCGMNSLI